MSSDHARVSRDSIGAQRVLILSHPTIRRFYDQGLEAVVRLITKLEDHSEDLQAQLTRNPQPAIASLSKELAKTKRTLARRSRELLAQQQLNHQLLRRLHELEQIWLASRFLVKSQNLPLLPE